VHNLSSKNKKIRDLNTGINYFKRGYQPRRMRMVICLQIPHHFEEVENIFSQLLNIHRVRDVRQIEIRVNTTEPLVHDPNPFDVEIAIAKLKSYKSPGSDQIPAELIMQSRR
jgi:hypothetical protein